MLVWPFLLEENQVRVIESSSYFTPVIIYNECQPNSVIPYSEVTNEIGNLLSTRCRFSIFAGVFEAQSRGE